MAKWCDWCYRNEMHDEWEPCSEDCPVFGKNFEELAMTVIVMKDKIEDVLDMMMDIAE